MHLRLILFGAASLVVSFFASLLIMNWWASRDDGASVKPALASMPPLPPATRSSTIVAPI